MRRCRYRLAAVELGDRGVGWPFFAWDQPVVALRPAVKTYGRAQDGLRVR